MTRHALFSRFFSSVSSPDLVERLDGSTCALPVFQSVCCSCPAGFQHAADGVTPSLCRQVSDRGGGVPRSVSDMLFHYMYSTAPKPSVAGDAAPLAGTRLTVALRYSTA